MISRRSLTLALAAALMPVTHAAAQVRPLGEVAEATSVQQAAHFGHAHDVHIGHYGTVWGADCLHGCKTTHPMFPPCPNPCRTTLLGEFCMHTKHALNKTFHYIFGPCGLCGCLSCHGDCCYDGEFYDGEFYDDGTHIESETIESGHPIPAGEGDPFTDDPDQPAGSGTKSTMRSVIPRTTQAKGRSPVRRVTHVEEVPQRRMIRPTATARPLSNPGYRTAKPRPIKPRYLRRAKSLPRESAPTLKFRDQ